MLKSLLNKALLKRDSNADGSCQYWEISKNTYFEEHLRTAASEETLGSDYLGFFFLESRFQNHPDLVILQKYQSLSNQALYRKANKICYKIQK